MLVKKMQVIYRWAFSVAPALCPSVPLPTGKVERGTCPSWIYGSGASGRADLVGQLMERKECYRLTHPLSNISGYATEHKFFFYIFTALHVMQTRYCDENSVRLSVCLSHACIVTKR